jgi:hypothetical protein
MQRQLQPAFRRCGARQEGVLVTRGKSCRKRWGGDAGAEADGITSSGFLLAREVAVRAPAGARPPTAAAPPRDTTPITPRSFSSALTVTPVVLTSRSPWQSNEREPPLRFPVGTGAAVAATGSASMRRHETLRRIINACRNAAKSWRDSLASAPYDSRLSSPASAGGADVQGSPISGLPREFHEPSE